MAELTEFYRFPILKYVLLSRENVEWVDVISTFEMISLNENTYALKIYKNIGYAIIILIMKAINILQIYLNINT